MYKNYKISVAIASYNGEKYIRKQLLSICNQTVQPDEIIISDDGSKDDTMSVLDAIKNSDISKKIKIEILSDNPKHGFVGNFEWAISHTTGDLIFIADQDDLWYPHKIQYIADIFDHNREALCVMHEADLIDGHDEPIKDIFNEFTQTNFIEKKVSEPYHIPRNSYLSNVSLRAITNGMVLCIHRKLFNTILPFPKELSYHDWWIEFCAIALDKCYYTAEVLTSYRLHSNNVIGNQKVQNEASSLSIIQIIKRFKSKKQLSIDNIIISESNYFFGKRAYEILKINNLENTEAAHIAQYFYIIDDSILSAARESRIKGAYMLLHLYLTNRRYRNSGFLQFFYQFLRILLYSKKARNRVLENYGNR